MSFVYPPRALPGLADAWGRVVQTRIEDGEKSVQQLSQVVNNGLRSQGGQLAVMADQVEEVIATQAALPVTLSDLAEASAVSINNTWVTKASVTVTAPPGKNRVQLQATGNAEALDTLTGGATVARSRLVINGQVSRIFSAAKDAGATQVNNVMSAVAAFSATLPVGGSVTVDYQLQTVHTGNAFPATPSNFAQVSVLATFTN